MSRRIIVTRGTEYSVVSGALHEDEDGFSAPPQRAGVADGVIFILANIGRQDHKDH